MNFKSLTFTIFGVLSSVVSVSHGERPAEIAPYFFSEKSGMNLAALSEPNEGNFEENRDHIFAVANEQLSKLSSLLLELPNYFDIDINEILEPSGLVFNSTLKKRSFDLQKRGFFSFLKDIVDTSLLAIGAVATVVTFFQPEFAPVAAAAFAIHDYLNKGVCQLPWVNCPEA